MNRVANPDAIQLLGLARSGNRSRLGALPELYRSYFLLARLQVGRKLQSKVARGILYD